MIGSKGPNFLIVLVVFFSLLLFNSLNASAQTDIFYFDKTFKPNIKTVILHKFGAELTGPVISLNGNDQLDFEFDDLNGNINRYYYTFIHCDANWKNSDIWQNEYLQGDPEGNIDRYAFSINTYKHYTHYSLTFPNDRVHFTLSGNYILKIYLRDQRGNEDLVITRRFMIVDPKVSVKLDINRPSIIKYMNSKQEVDFTVQNSGMQLVDPNYNVHVSVLQNGRWDNALKTLQPFMVSNYGLDYRNPDGSNLFDGCNEFRYFDTKSVLRLSEKMKSLKPSDSGYVVELWPFPARMFKPYSFEEDINGNFIIRNSDYGDESIQSEYVWVHFILPFNMANSQGDMYVAGNFNTWQFTPENKMNYNINLKAYECWLYLKQGYYNYLFALVPKGKNFGDTAFIDGNHYETGNNYTVLVYYRAPGTLYDQLIGFNSKTNLGK